MRMSLEKKYEELASYGIPSINDVLVNIRRITSELSQNESRPTKDEVSRVAYACIRIHLATLVNHYKIDIQKLEDENEEGINLMKTRISILVRAFLKFSRKEKNQEFETKLKRIQEFQESIEPHIEWMSGLEDRGYIDKPPQIITRKFASRRSGPVIA